MIKIQFLLKKPHDKQEGLEYISISDPKINEVRDLGWNSYVCEIYFSDINHTHPPIYGTNPIEPLCLALEIVKSHLQGLVFGGYTISEIESKASWKLLEKKDPKLNLQEKIEKIKNDKNISQEDKQKILGILKDTFGKLPHMKDQINKAINEN